MLPREGGGTFSQIVSDLCMLHGGGRMNQVEGSSVNRRTVITGLCASGLIAACSSSPAMDEPQSQAMAAARAQGQALANGEMDRWSAKVGTEFTTAGFRIKLAGVQPLESTGVRPANVTRDSAFRVLFDVLDGGQMPGDIIYGLSASGVGPLDVFISSVGTREYPNRMDAVFN